MTCKAWLLLSCMAVGAGALIPAATPLAAQEQGVNGTNVSRVEFNQGSVIQKVAPKVWMEYDPAGNPTNRFEERSRDEWSVYLYDPSRNLRLAVDMHRRELIIVGDNGDLPVMGTITGASVTPKMAARQPAPQPVSPAPQTAWTPSPQPAPIAQPPATPAFVQAPRTPVQPAFTAQADPADDADFDPYAAPAQTSAAPQQPTFTTSAPKTNRDIITAAAQPAFTRRDGGASGNAANAVPDASIRVDGPWIAIAKDPVKSGNGVTTALTWEMPESVWITEAQDGSITIHFDKNPAGSITLQKVGELQYSAGGNNAQFFEADRKDRRKLRFVLNSGGQRREFQISFVPSGVKLSRSRTRPEVDDEVDTFTSGATVPRFKDMLRSYRSPSMDLFDAGRGAGPVIFKEPESTEYSVELEMRSMRIPLGLRGKFLRDIAGSQMESVITNTSSFEKSMSLNFGASGSFKGASSGWEATREQSKGADRTDGTTKAFGLSRSDVFALFIDKPNMLLDAYFKDAILQLADGVMTPAQFRERYGTHYASAIHFGGLSKAERTVTTTEFKQWAKESTSYKQDGGFDAGPAGSIKAKGGLTLASGDSTGRNSMFSSESWKAVGGTGGMTSASWTVGDENSVPVRYDLRPLSELISPMFFPEEWSSPKRNALINARAQLDNEITRYLQSQPKADDRLLGPAVYQLTFHGLKCLNNGDEGSADAYLYGDINATITGLEPSQTVNLFTATEANPTKISCNGGAEHPINRTVFVTSARRGETAASFHLTAPGLYEDDNSFTDLDDPLSSPWVFPNYPGTQILNPFGAPVPVPVVLRDWRADVPRYDFEGIVITNQEGGPYLKVSVSFKEIQ